jgi:AbiV family abortive infection protein
VRRPSKTHSALLEEADTLRSHERCARAYYLAHIACEELGKLPILAALAVSVWMETEVDWKKIDGVLRSHASKIKQVLFMDSLQGQQGLREGAEAYEDDVRRLRAYTDMKNASLYSFHSDGRFLQPNDVMSCEVFDRLRRLAEGRREAFAGYMQPMRGAGGMEAFLKGAWVARANDFIERLLGDEGRAAFREYERSGDESATRSLYDRLLASPGGQEHGATTESGPLAEERLEEERQRMRELTSPSPDVWKDEPAPLFVGQC